jgi:hypothetical protein
MDCDHSGTQSGASRYLRESAQLRLVLVCDRCGAECNELSRLDYRPGGRDQAGVIAAVTARRAGLGRAVI